MGELTRVGDLDLSQNLGYEWRAYRVRQVFAVVFGLILVAALLGVLGRSGPLSETSASAGGALTVDYERFLRLNTPTEVQVRIGAGEGDAKVALSQELLEDFRVRSYSAQPQETTVLPDRVVYTFALEPPSEVTFVLEPQEIGRQRGTVHGPGERSVDIRQWVWP